MKRMFSALLCCVTGLLLSINTAQAQASKRVALLIGNTNYLHYPLLNPSNDVQGIGAALKTLGFSVIERRDQSRQALFSSLDQFSQAARGADIALVFYSGHGLQVAQENYLIPINENIATLSKDNISTQALALSAVTNALEASQATVKVAIFDACRDNANKGASPVINNSFTETTPASGTLLAYSTAPGKQAADVGQDASGKPLANSPYAHALIQALRTQLTLQDVFVSVQGEVAKLTQLRQTPWTVNGLTGKVVLREAGGLITEPPTISTPATHSTARKALANMGLMWNQATFNETLLRNDTQAAVLFFEGGMKINDGSVLNQWLASKHSAATLTAAIKHRGVDDTAVCARLKLADVSVFYNFKKNSPEFKLLSQMSACKKIIDYQISSQRDPQGAANDLLKNFQTAVGVGNATHTANTQSSKPAANPELEKTLINIVDLSQAINKK